jgi:hypothetical protein
MIAACVLGAVPAPSQLMITEVHPTPSSGEPEWVECVNTSAQAVRVDGWLVCDNRTCAALGSVNIPAEGFVVFVRDAEALSEARFVPPDVVVLECSLPSLNNSVDRVELRRSDSSLVDSVTYDVRRNIKGLSIERCGTWTSGVVTYGNTWGPSMRRDSASCGLLNSCVRLPMDVRVLPAMVEDTAVVITVLNVGLQSSPARRRSIYAGDVRLRDEVPGLEPGRSDRLRLDLRDIGLHDTVRRVVLTVVLGSPDDRPDNDTIEQEITLPTIEPRITITEMMAEPNERQSEYIEIWNGTPVPVDLSGWTLEDASKKRATIVPSARIESGGFLAVAADTAIAQMAPPGAWTLMRPALNINATTDTITLRTPQGVVVDRVPYDEHAHVNIHSTRGIALERRVPWTSTPEQWGSWTSSTDMSGGTPGRANSIGRPPPVISGMRSWPDPCSAVPTSASYPCVISWVQPLEQCIGRLRVYRSDGVFVTELLNGELIGNRGSAVWDMRDARTGAAAAVGIYVAVLECSLIATPGMHVDRCIINVGQSDDVVRKR